MFISNRKVNTPKVPPNTNNDTNNNNVDTNQNAMDLIAALKLFNQYIKKSMLEMPPPPSNAHQHELWYPNKGTNNDQLTIERYMCYREWKQAALVIDRLFNFYDSSNNEY